METVLGQPSWRFENDACRGWVSEVGGMTGPVEFRLGNRWVSPFHVAPWAEEELEEPTPPLLQALRGDFLCMPFGSNDTPFQGELHPPHGETANLPWHLESAKSDTLQLGLTTTIRPGKVRKTVRTRAGESVLYIRHEFEGFTGPMALGHHAMLRFQSAGLISTSPFIQGRVHPGDFEGKTSLPDGRIFASLEELGLVQFPAREGHEDLVELTSNPLQSFAWTAVSFPEENYIWFSLKNPRILRSTILWFSNAGRDHAPWNGRHRGVMGLEEVTAEFNFGLAESVEAGAVLELSTLPPISVLMGVVDTQSGMGRVASITPVDGGLSIVDDSGREATVSCDLGWLSG